MLPSCKYFWYGSLATLHGFVLLQSGCLGVHFHQTFLRLVHFHLQIIDLFMDCLQFGSWEPFFIDDTNCIVVICGQWTCCHVASTWIPWIFDMWCTWKGLWDVNSDSDLSTFSFHHDWTSHLWKLLRSIHSRLRPAGQTICPNASYSLEKKG